MATLLSKVKIVFAKYPLTRGMASYALIWPIGNLVHQTLDGRTLKTYDWVRVGRFMVFGGFFVAPSLYCWIKVSSAMWPRTDILSAMAKAATEQVSYTPAAMTCFYFGMSLFEGKTVKQSANEVSNKFVPTYKVAVVVWPFISTVNFWLIPEKNRVVVVSFCSLIWSSFLAWMQHMEHHEIQEMVK